MGWINTDNCPKAMKIIKVKKISLCRDGGTKLCIDELGNKYYQDRRIASETYGKWFDRYPSDLEANLINAIFLLESND